MIAQICHDVWLPYTNEITLAVIVICLFILAISWIWELITKYKGKLK